MLPKMEFRTNSNQRTLDIFVWGDYFDPEMISRFEKEHNAKIQLHYYSSNEEMMLKLRAHKGNGYDLIVPSDYAVQILIKENLLQPIDYKKIDFMHKISPVLLNHSFDPNNRYSIPNMWEVYGIGYDPTQMDAKKLRPTLGHFFDENLIDYKFSMTPDPIEAIVFASCYLYGMVDHLTNEQAEEVKSLLLKQKPHVEAYADYRAKYLMQTKNCPVSILRSSLLFHIARENPHMGFIIPDEATITSIENIAIPIGSKKQDLVYEFINFIYQDDVHASQLSICPLYPAVETSLPYTDECEAFYTSYKAAIQKKNFYFFKHVIPEEEIRDMWVEIKN
jgi:spermidine/putrescine transport system substrate-binding protein